MISIESMEETSEFIYKLILSYKGTHYYGWQSQAKHEETVQNHVEKVISKISRYKVSKVIAASRTDAGVHASGQVLKVTLPREIEPDILTTGMNSMLPSDIKVIKSEFIHKDFNVNRDSKFKEYHYYFTINQNENAAFFDSTYTFPKELNLKKIQEACNILIGDHNFKSFCVPGPNPGTLHRKILQCSIEKSNFLTFNTDIYYLKIQGEGFLRYMVRYLMGALWDIGVGKLSLEDFTLSLKNGEMYGVRTKAPARGLHLINIEY